MIDGDVLKKENFLSEFDSEAQKALVRHNLGLDNLQFEQSGYTQEEVNTLLDRLEVKVNSSQLDKANAIRTYIDQEVEDLIAADEAEKLARQQGEEALQKICDRLDRRISAIDPTTSGGGATMEQVRLAIEDYAQPKGDYATITYVNELTASLNDFALKSDLADFVTLDAVKELIPSLEEYATEEYVTKAIADALANVKPLPDTPIDPNTPTSDCQVIDVLVNGESIVKNKIAQIELPILSISVNGEAIEADENGNIDITVAGSGEGLTASQKSLLTTLQSQVSAGKILSTNDYDDFATAQVAKIVNLEQDSHTHSNLALLESITQEQIDAWSSNGGLTSEQIELLNKVNNLTNIDTLTSISQSDITAWNAIKTADSKYPSKTDIQTLQASNTALQQENALLKSQNSDITTQLAQLKADIEALREGREPEEVDVLTAITVSPEVITINAGESVPAIQVTASYSKSNPKTIALSDCTGTSSDLAVATWNNGIIAKNPGSTAIMIKYSEGGIEKSCSVILTIKAAPQEVVLTSIEPSTKSITKKVGASPVAVTFTAKYSDGSSNPILSISGISSDSTVARWENNKVTIGEEGSTILTFTYEGKSCQIPVNVLAETEQPTTTLQYVGYARTQDRIFQNSLCETESVEGTWNASNTQWLDPEEAKHYLFIITTEDIKEIGAPGVGTYTLSDINRGIVTDDAGNTYTIYRIGPAANNSSEIFINLN